MKILITGGVGFIGCNLTTEAIRRGYEVVAFDNLSRNEVKNNLTYLEKTYKDKFTFVWGDVRKADDFDKVLEYNVDAVINMAANPSVIKSIAFPRYDFETNTLGTLNSLEFARKLNVPYIYASTNKVYSDITNIIPIIEEEKRYCWAAGSPPDRWNFAEMVLIKEGIDINKNNLKKVFFESINDKFPVDGFGKYGHSLYGISKLAGELLVQEYGIQFGLPIVIFRMSCIFGLHQLGVEEQAWCDHFLRKIMFGDRKINIFGTGKQVRDVLDGRDTARAYLDALEDIDKVRGEVFTLGGGPENTYSLFEAIEIIEKSTGKKASVLFHPKRPSDQDIYISSLTKIKEKLGWEPKIKFEDALKDMINAYKK